MYVVVLTVHSALRWVVLLLGIIAAGAGFAGWAGGRRWQARDDRIDRAFTIVFDVQVLLGLSLYAAFSPLTQAAMRAPAAAMRDAVLRFWFVEHITGMIVAFTCAHLGRALTRGAGAGARRHRTAAIWFGLSVVAILVTIPWPMLPYGRPLLRW